MHHCGYQWNLPQHIGQSEFPFRSNFRDATTHLGKNILLKFVIIH